MYHGRQTQADQRSSHCRSAVLPVSVHAQAKTVNNLLLTSSLDLQQTPETSAKVMLKIFEEGQNGGDPVAYLFHFNTSEAKAEASAIKDVLSRLLAAKAHDSTALKAATAKSDAGPASNTSGSATMAFASAANSQQATRWLDDQQLKADIALQQSLIEKDKNLNRTYRSALETKPESLSVGAFNSQFWSTRINLLRAHAIETSQKKGAYNVLSTVKPRTVDGELKLNISVEQVHMIFAQHPLVKRIYDENVPKLSAADFWSRFFLSRLSKKLRGERVTENDAPDAIFDNYDASDNLRNVTSKITQSNVPHIIDIEANEENQGGFRSGNAKDVEMRPRANIPLVQTLNSLSEKIMANVAPSDADINDGHSKAQDELALRDLLGDSKETRIMLHVKEQNKFFGKQNSEPSSNAKVFAKQDPGMVITRMQRSLSMFQENETAGVDLQTAIDYDDDEEDDDDKASRSGARLEITHAEKDIINGIAQQRAQKYGHTSDAAKPMGLSTNLADECTITHATTIEFLHQFWDTFLSGDPDRASELQQLAESLQRSVNRINATGDQADKEREDIIRQRKQEIREHFERTGKKIRWKSDMVGGGRPAVMKLMQPTLDALSKAQADYTRALAAEGLQLSTEA